MRERESKIYMEELCLYSTCSVASNTSRNFPEISKLMSASSSLDDVRLKFESVQVLWCCLFSTWALTRPDFDGESILLNG